MPCPGALNGCIERHVPRQPAEFTARSVRSRDQLGRITFAPRSFVNGNRPAADFARKRDHFSNAVASTRSQIERTELSRWHTLHGPQVSVRQILDVHVVANARTVRSRIIRPENLNV